MGTKLNRALVRSFVRQQWAETKDRISEEHLSADINEFSVLVQEGLADAKAGRKRIAKLIADFEVVHEEGLKAIERARAVLAAGQTKEPLTPSP